MTTKQISNREVAALLSVAFLIVAGDYLFWREQFGLSVGIFALFALGAVCLIRAAKPNRCTYVALALLIPTVIQTGIDQSFSNLVVLCALCLALFGEFNFGELRAGWPRWSEAIVAFLQPIGAWLWFSTALRNLPRGSSSSRRLFDGIFRIALPAIALATVFAILLGSGNAIVGHWVSDEIAVIFRWLIHFDLSLGRIFFWMVLATFALMLVRPRSASPNERLWTRRIPEFSSPMNATIARWRTLAVLALLNVLFFAANTIDAIYLWRNASLPAGVSYSEFVHNGVYSLSAAVVLSAIVLVSLFQQTAMIRNPAAVRALSLVWIAQNLILIAGVALRLLRYVQAYQLSELRIYVGCFLLLVSFGFSALVLHILSPGNLNRLIFQNLLATFALFFVLQFLDVQCWVAQEDVARWKNDPLRTLDVAYLDSLGTSAYPWLIEVAETPGRSEAHQAFECIQARKGEARDLVVKTNWRSLQWRRLRNSRLLANHEVRTRG